MSSTLNAMSDLLTQKAKVYARAQTWAADGGEDYGAETELYTNIPCLLVPMSPDRAALNGLNFSQRPYSAFFEATRYITRSSAGQAYQDVRITVNSVDYMAVGTQQRFGEDLDVDDVDHVEVPVVRRDSA